MESVDGSRECPACGQPLYGWIELDTPAGPTLLERCENCRLGLAAGMPADDASHELLAGKAGLDIVRLRSPRRRRALVWMWQTIVNAFTFNENFALRVRQGDMHPQGASERLKYGVDMLVTVLATPLVLFVSIPMELIADQAGSGGVLVAVAAQSSDEYEKVDQ